MNPPIVLPRFVAPGLFSLCSFVLLSGLVAGCSGDDDDSMSATGTCASTCTKSIALACPEGVHDQTACVTSCNGQQASCVSAGAAPVFQAYLDCIESHEMTCGATTRAPTSSACVQQGLAIFACGLTLGGDGGI